MVGVPTSRKCENCRKRKKKCDLAQPSCGRCVRLGIVCGGSGRLRYTFADDRQSKNHSSSGTSTPGNSRGLLTLPPKPSSTLLDAIRSTYISSIQANEGDLRWDFMLLGPFLKDVPRRLGRSKVLDDATCALNHSFASFRAREPPSREAARSYAKALATLRNGLGDLGSAANVDMLLAIWIIIVTQTLMGDGLHLAHGVGLARLLSVMPVPDERQHGAFEMELLWTITVPVVIESIVNPQVQLHPWLESMTKERDAKLTLNSLKFSEVEKLRYYFDDPVGHCLSIRLSYQRFNHEMALLRQSMDIPLPPLYRLRIIACYGIILSHALLLNGLIRRRLGSIDDPSIADDSKSLIDQAISLTYEALHFRPMGSSSMITLLMAAWPIDPRRRPEIEVLVEDLLTDFPMTRWMASARWLDAKMGKQGFVSSVEETRLPPSGACTIL